VIFLIVSVAPSGAESFASTSIETGVAFAVVAVSSRNWNVPDWGSTVTVTLAPATPPWPSSTL
jgi:hypothetical protein